MNWTHKYKPNSIKEVVGQESSIKDIISCIKNKRPVIVYGSVGVGKIGTIPGGHAEYKPHMTDLIDHLSVEFEEELGYTPSETEKISLIGVFLNRDTNGVNALYKIRTCLDYPEIKSRWQKAKDSYEHQSLIRLSKDEIISLTENWRLAYENVEYTTTPFFIDSFVNYMRFAV